MLTIGFIGTGNMGGALARAAAKEEGNRLLLHNRSPEKAQKLASELHAEVTDQAGALEADFVFLGVKPQMLEQLFSGLRPLLAERDQKPVLVSMAAVTSIRQIREMAGCALPIIRIMPNTPVAIGQGITLYACSPEVSEETEETFLRAMAASGRFIRSEEKYIDAGACISGCGPAFVDLFVEALADGGVACGLPRAMALELAAAMTAGAAGLILETGKHPAQLKDEVCSPGGTTIRGVRALEQGAFRSAAMEAVLAAYGK